MEESRGAKPVLRRIGTKSKAMFAPLHTLTEVRTNRFLVRNLIRREVRGRYRNAALGYAWTVIEPALLASVYWFLFIMLSGNPDKMYAVWVLLGVIVWGCFSKSPEGVFLIVPEGVFLIAPEGVFLNAPEGVFLNVSSPPPSECFAFS